MSFATTPRILAVAGNLAEEAGRHPAKELMRLLGVSRMTVTTMRRGVFPNTITMLRAVEIWPKIIEPLLGIGANNAARLQAMESSLKEFADAFSQIRLENSQGLARLRSLRGIEHGGMAGRDAAGSAGGACSSSEPGGEAAGGIALVETRSTANSILSRAEGAGLQRHLTSNVVSLDAARALVQGDNLGRTGLAYRRQGEDWSVIPAPENRLWAPDPEPRPISRYQGNVVALRRSLEEASQSSDPVFVTHAGAVLIDGVPVPFHSAVVRIGREFRCGTRAVITDFARLGAA